MNFDEFFKLFEILNENGKQIIVTSDRKACDLDIMDRLKSRFGWGMQVDVRKPDKELRKNILKNIWRRPACVYYMIVLY